MIRSGEPELKSAPEGGIGDQRIRFVKSVGIRAAIMNAAPAGTAYNGIGMVRSEVFME
jgi:hypothetical protein